MSGGHEVAGGSPGDTSGTGHRGRSRDSPVADAWERFAAGDDVTGGVREEILVSWYRCRDEYDVDPRLDRAPVAPDDDSSHSLRDEVVLAELGGIAKSIEPDVCALDAVVAVADGTGRVVAAWGEEQALEQGYTNNLAPWFTWSEQTTGTNGMGTALMGREPTLVRRWEHWCSGFHDLSCAGIAIRDPVTDEPLGVLDISSWRKLLPDGVLGWLERAAAGIEGDLMKQANQSFAVLAAAFGQQARRAHGLLAAADAGGRLVLANDEALRLFGGPVADPAGSDLRGRPEFGPAELHELVPLAVAEARRNPSWIGSAEITLPYAGVSLPATFRPVVRDRRVLGILLNAPSLEGEPLPAGAPPDTAAPGRLVGVRANHIILLSPNELRFAEAEGNLIWLHTEHGRLRSPERGLGRLERRLRGQGFLQVHRRFVVNLERVREIVPSPGGIATRSEGSFCLLVDGEEQYLIPVSRRRAPEVRKALGL